MISKNNKQICVIISKETDKELEKTAQLVGASKSQIANFILCDYLGTLPKHLKEFLNR